MIPPPLRVVAIHKDRGMLAGRRGASFYRRSEAHALFLPNLILAVCPLRTLTLTPLLALLLPPPPPHPLILHPNLPHPEKHRLPNLSNRARNGRPSRVRWTPDYHALRSGWGSRAWWWERRGEGQGQGKEVACADGGDRLRGSECDGVRAKRGPKRGPFVRYCGFLALEVILSRFQPLS